MARKKLGFHWWMLAALILAAYCGWALHLPEDKEPSRQVAMLVATLNVVGALFLRALNMVVLPLVMTSLISGMAGLGRGGKFGRVGLKTFFYYLTTTALAVATGLILVNLISPGVGANLPLPAEGMTVAAPENVSELITRLVPKNIFSAMAEADMLGVIFFSLVFGLTLNFVSASTRDRIMPVVDAILAVMMKITHAIIMLAPIGVFALVTPLVMELKASIFKNLGWYAFTVALGLVIHFFVTLPLLMFLLARVNPYRVMARMADALFTAFSTASSSATLPLTMERAEKGVGVPNRVASFVLPLGATVNMDGTALYECVAVIFLAQALGHSLDATQQVMVFTGAVLISIGAAGIPHAGLVMMTIILGAVGLPLHAAALIWSVDRILDMCRTATNVWSDVTGSVVIAATEHELEMPRDVG